MQTLCRKHCLYHDEKDNFCAVMPKLKHLFGIPRKLMPYVAMTICSCRTKMQNRTGVEELNQLEKQEPLSDSQLLKGSSLTGSNQPEFSELLTFVARAIAAKTSGNESALRFVLLLKMAFRDNFQLIFEEQNGRSMSGLKGSSGDTNIRSAHTGLKGNVSQAIPFILRKRKRQSDGKFLYVLPMHGALFKSLLSDKDLGENFCTLSVKYKPCVIELDYARTGEKMGKLLKETILNIWCRRADLLSIVKLLRGKAVKIQDLQDKNHKLMRHQQREVSYYRRLQPLYNFDTNNLFQLKEHRQDQYLKKKCFGDRKKPSPLNRKTPVKCYNCQREQCTVSHKYDILDTTIIPSRACTCHPGFIVGKKNWSCCGRDVDMHLTARDQHSKNGCTQGPHQWRYQTRKFPSEIEDSKHLATESHVIL